MKSHFLKENDVVLSSRWQFQDGRSKGMGTEWDQEVVVEVCEIKPGDPNILFVKL